MDRTDERLGAIEVVGSVDPPSASVSVSVVVAWVRAMA